ncbi:MAG: hypothetical protein OXT64_04430 [Gammaproteobacteria bacterium]|nr:hypothetical protein [Gammaproteobacteria bacterium]
MPTSTMNRSSSELRPCKLKGVPASVPRAMRPPASRNLESRKLIELTRNPMKDWRAKLTRHGWDVTSYVVDCEPGIARPQKYWGDGAR